MKLIQIQEKLFVADKIVMVNLDGPELVVHTVNDADPFRFHCDSSARAKEVFAQVFGELARA